MKAIKFLDLIQDDGGKLSSVIDEEATSSLRGSNKIVVTIGPPGAGKSTLCNAIISYQNNWEPNKFFNTSTIGASHTQGIWVLPQEVKVKIKNKIWDVIDMEGFQVDEKKCWIMTMITCLLADVVIICDRNPRSDTLKKSISTLLLGFEKAEALAVKPRVKKIYLLATNEKFGYYNMTNTDLAALSDEDLESAEQAQNDMKDIERKIKEKLLHVEVLWFPIDINHSKYNGNISRINAGILNDSVYKDFVEKLVKSFPVDTENCSGDNIDKIKQVLVCIIAGNDTKCIDIARKFFIEELKHLIDNQTMLLQNKFDNQIMKEIRSITDLNINYENFIVSFGKPKIEIDITKSIFYSKKMKDDEEVINMLDKRLVPGDIVRQHFEDHISQLKTEREIKNEILRTKLRAELNLAKVRIDEEINRKEFMSDIDIDFFPFLTRDTIRYAEEENIFFEENSLLYIPLRNYYITKRENKMAEWRAFTESRKRHTKVEAMNESTCGTGHRITTEVFCFKHKTEPIYWIHYSQSGNHYVYCNICNILQGFDGILFCLEHNTPSGVIARPPY